MLFFWLPLTYASSICSNPSEIVQKTLDIFQEKLQQEDCVSTMKTLRTTNSMNIEGLNIEDISPLSEAKNLRVLLMANNKISDLSALQSLSLRWLDVSNNPISDLDPISNMHNLETLWASSLQLSSIDALKDMKKLQYLSVENNQIVDIAGIRSIKKLKFLGLSQNAIKDFRSLSEHQNLEYMTVKGNPIVFCPKKGLLANICNKEKNK